MNLFAVTYSAVRDLLTRLTTVRAGNLDQIDATRMAKLDTLEARLTALWAAKLDTLETRLGATWAGKLDTLEARLGSVWAAKLDTAISSRAAADTAVSTANYTSGRATKVDFLDALISSRMASIKSIRRGTITINSGNSSGTATLSPAVDLAKTLLIPLGSATPGSATIYLTEDSAFRVELTNTTTVTATRGGTTNSMYVGYQIIEFN